MNDVRPWWPEYFLGIAKAVAVRGDCTRRQVGCVIEKGHRVVSTGYNGAPSGQPGCLSAGACPRGKHYRALDAGGPPVDGVVSLFGKMCACGNTWPCPETVDPGSSYDTGPGACISIHAEANALLYADYALCKGAYMYVTAEPCGGCRKLIAAAGINGVVWATAVPGHNGFWNVTGVIPGW
jgi:dCMP deaminase